MKIKLVTGATTYEAAINVIEKIDPKDLRIENLVVVPDSFSMQAESLIFDVLKVKSAFNIQVVGISRLASKILRNKNIQFQRISGLEEIFNIFKAIKRCEPNFVYFNKCGVDFCVKILQIIKQFKACKIRPEQIKSVGDDLLDRKMRDLKNIYIAYEELLGDKLDLSKLLEFFVENTQNNIDLSKTKLFFINFDSFSSEINSFICKLAGVVNEVCIGYSRPISIGNAFIYEDDILKKTTQYAKEYGVTVEVENPATKLTGEHLTLAKNLFAFEVEEGKSDKFFNVLAKNRLDEIEFVAKYIKHQVVNGARYKDFAIAIADKSYYEQIKTTFDEFEITAYCDEATDLSKTILGRFILKILQIAKLGFQKENLKFLVSSILIDVEDREKILTEMDYFNIEDKTEFLERYPEFCSLIFEIENLRKCSKNNQFVQNLQKIIGFVDKNYVEVLSALNEKQLYKKQSENSQAKELIAQVFEKLSELGKEDEIDLFDFENLCTLAFESVKVETIPSYVDAVYIGDASSSYFETTKTLFVLGATANSLPKTQNDTGIIDDDDIKKLRFEFALEPEIKVLNRRSRLKLFETLQHFHEKLIVCSPMMEGDKVSQKAGFVNDLMTMFGKNIIHTASALDINLGIYSQEEKIDKLLFYVGNEQNLLNAYIKLKTENKLPVEMLTALKSLLKTAIPNDDRNIIVNKALLAKMLLKNNRFSASQLETYFSCPFKHFVSYGLKIKQKETVEPNKRLFGIFEHSLLQKFVEENQFTLSKMTEKNIDEFLKLNLGNLAKEVYDENVLKKGFFLDYLHNESKLILRNVVKEQKYSQFKPLSLEEKIYQPFVDDINIVGFVDRVDQCGNYFRIIDYKTGKTESIKKELFYGKKLQLFLYANCMKKKLGLDCAGVYYFDCQTKYSKLNQTKNLFNGVTKKDNDIVTLTDDRLWEEDVKSDILGMSRKKKVKDGEFAFKNGNTTDNLQDLFVYAEKISKQALEEIKEGYIEPKPFKDECSLCPYSSVCRFSHKNGTRQMKSIKDEDLKGKNS